MATLAVRLARVTLEAAEGRCVRAVIMVMQGRFRQYWKSWLALSVLVAVAGGFVGYGCFPRRTADAFPQFAARHGYDVIVYSGQPLPQLARLPHVASALPVPATLTGRLRCASCRTPIDADSTLINEVPPRELPRKVTLLSGRMPDQSDPDEVLLRSPSPKTTACASAR